MSLVVSDTSPVRALASLGLLELLPQMFGEVIIPPTVARELGQPRGGGTVVLSTSFPFLIIKEPSDKKRVKELQEGLDPGEAEAIALAAELDAMLLIDELDGRAMAATLGVRVTGVVGILLEAKESSRLTAIRPLLDRLREENRFFISDQFYLHVVKRAGVTGMPDGFTNQKVIFSGQRLRGELSWGNERGIF